MIRVIPTGPFQVNTLIVSLSGSDVFIVDPAACSFSEDEEAISSILAEERLNPVAFVLTHGHFDHVCGLSHLKKLYPEVPVLIHEADKAWIGKDGLELQKRSLSVCGVPVLLKSVEDMPEADGFILDGKSLFDSEPVKSACESGKIPGQSADELKKWEIASTPGHSKGSVCLYNAGSNELIVGDTIFYDGTGRTDLPFGDGKEIRRSIKMIYERFPKDAKTYPGHEGSGFKLEYSRPLFY
ncbi:MAG: MBL fold metallo-hydrolase [Treponema sp.]|nr:MBL fold metallo-hydrolase [Treponema sp.]